LKKSIAIEISSVISCLAETDGYWKLLVSKEFSSCLQITIKAVSIIAKLAYKEMEDEKDLRTEQYVEDINIIYGTLHLLGANTTLLVPGTSCSYNTSTAFSETAVILSSCIAEEEQDSETGTSDRSYGSHCRIYSPSTKKILSVPASKVSRIHDTTNHVLSSHFLQNTIDNTLLVQLYAAICDLDINEKRKIRLPLKEYHYVTKTFESVHPYASGIDSYTLVEFPGIYIIINLTHHYLDIINWTLLNRC
jgi:hypothetical protein